jgi:hypothetical protein
MAVCVSVISQPSQQQPHAVALQQHRSLKQQIAVAGRGRLQANPDLQTSDCIGGQPLAGSAG